MLSSWVKCVDTALSWMKGLLSNVSVHFVRPRCLNTAQLVFDKVVPEKELHVSEYVRERMGVETCDARRALSGPRTDIALDDVVDGDEVDRKHKKHKRKHRVNCDYKKVQNPSSGPGAPTRISFAS